MENEIVNNINRLIHNNSVKAKIDTILKQTEKSNLDCDNLFSCFDLQAKLILLQIFAGQYQLDINKINLDELVNNFEKVVVDIIQEKYSPKNKAEFLEIVCNNYLVNGYMCHGTSQIHFENIVKNGLNGNNNFRNIKILNKVNDIFLAHKRKKCFEGKMNLLSSNSFYISDHIYSGIYYAYQSPEYFSRFCANGHLMRENDYDRFAYFRRDKEICCQNLKLFCDKNNFTHQEKQEVVNCFKILWNENVHQNEHFYLFLIPRKLVNRTEETTIEYLRENLSNLTKRQMISNLLRPRHIHDKIFLTLPAESLLYIPLIDLHKKFKGTSIGEKYITRESKKFVFDLVRDIPYVRKHFYKFNNSCDYNIPSDLYVISNVNEEKIIERYCDLFANECIANTPYGIEVIEKARKLTSLKDIKLKLLKRAKKDLTRCKYLIDNDVDKCFKNVYKMMFEYIVMFKTIIDNNDWFSNLNTADYYTAYGQLDPDYMILKAKDSNIYDYNLLSQRLQNIESFICDLDRII